jgi:chromosome segregation protein
MYLKSLTLHGFKSFADKTHFEFHQGVTGIVGPNGCGKSNVVDAIRWVLGETSAKALRGDEMADVIFNGTDKRKPVGMAEVTLTMADCEGVLPGVEYNEVAITRRVYRDGKGEYRLNNTLCRLKDIHDLLAGTGIGRAAYSIMAQGQIDMLLSSKPEDRRAVFEEAAGITKFKGQKREALRKLEYTEANLLRVADIIAEVKRQMGSLQRQAAKARRYQALLTDTRVLDTHLGHKHFTELKGEKEETENQIRSLLLQLNEAHRLLHSTEAEATETREAYHAIESTISQLRQQAQELRAQVQSAEGRIGFNRERTEELEHRIQRHAEDMEAARELVDQQVREMASADEQVLVIRQNIEGRQLALNEHQGTTLDLVPERQRIEHERRITRESIRQFDGQIAGSEARVQSLTTQISNDRQRHEALARDRQSAAQVRETAQHEYDGLRAQIDEHEATRNELDEKLKSCSLTIAEQRRQRDTLDNEVNELQRTTTQRKSRLEALKQLIAQGEGLAEGTQAVLRGLDNPEVYRTGVRGILASSIEVEPQFITAIEAALREHLQAVLLTESELAMQVVDRLSQYKMGKAAVAPQDFFAERPQINGQFLPEGALAWAMQKVKAREGSQKMVEHLLAHVVIAEDLHTAMRIKRAHPEIAIATMRGEFISADGIIYGGATKEEAASTLRRESEVRSLATEVEALELQLMEKEDLVADLRSQLEEKQREESMLREQSQRTRESLSQFQGKMSVVQRELQQAVAKAESIEWDQQQIATRIEQADALILQLRESVAAAAEQLEQAREHERELEVEADALARRELESTERLNELRTALLMEQSALQAIERQKAPMKTRLAELQGSIQRYEQEIMVWRERILQGQSESQRLAEQVEEQRVRLSEVEEQGAETTDRRTAAFEKVTQLEAQLSKLRNDNSQMSEHRNRAEVQLTRVDLRLENVVSQMMERHQVSIDAFEPDPHALLLSIANQKKARGRGKGKGDDSDSSPDEVATVAVAEPVVEAVAAEEPVAVPTTDDQAEVVAEDMPIVEESDVVVMDESEISAGNEAADGDQIVVSVEELKAIESVLPQGRAELTQEDWDFVAEAVAELRQRLEGIGPVNLDAIQEFEELEERHRFLETQHSDLVKSKEELLQVIAKINDTTKMMFSETFEKVRLNFQNNFRELFGAQAKADLMLEEGDVLEAGIEIIAKPPGKKLQTISLLSGGERSMCAVALLFSIYQVKPSPFCVLDELDAPLDESNISRFLKMLENFIGSSQFIIVTHNKRTMSRADVIYGVTMQEFGVSKPVGVRMTSEDDVNSNIERQRGIGKVASDGVVDELPAGGRKPRAKRGKKADDVAGDEFAALVVDSEQAAALDEQAGSEVVFAGDAETIDEEEDGVGLSA